MASWSLLAIKAASDSATPSTRDQVRRRLTGSSCRGCGNAPRGKTRREFRHDAGAFRVAHQRPLGDFVDGAAATEAKPGMHIKRADLDAGALDCGHGSSMWLNRLRR